MLDLKPLYDAVNAADAAMKAQAEAIASLLAEGTEDSISRALALQDTLDTLQADYDKKLALYQSVVKANQPSDVARLFVPATNPQSEDESPKMMKRSDWIALDFSARESFIKGGGKIED